MSSDNSPRSEKRFYIPVKDRNGFELERPPWNTSTNIKPCIGRLHRPKSPSVSARSFWKNIPCKISGRPAATAPWDDNLPSRTSGRPAARGARGFRETATASANLTGRARQLGRETIFSRVSSSARQVNNNQDYDDEEQETPPFDRYKYFANVWKWRSHLNPPWPKVSIATKLAAARKSKKANMLHKDKPNRNSSDEEEEEQQQPTGFLDLTSNIRYKIFNYIPTKERVKLQLVCRMFRDDIRVRIGIGTFCDETTTWGLSFMRDLMVDTIIVGNYRQPVLRPRDLILRWFDVLHLEFAGYMSIPYMDAWVNRCRGVRKITVSGEVCERPPIPTDPERRRDYRSWRKVELIRKIPYTLHYCKLLEIRPTGSSPHLSVQCTLGVCRCVNIVKLKVVIDTPQQLDNTKAMYKAILKFMLDNPSLQDVWVQSKVTEFARPSFIRKETLMLERDLRLMSGKCQLKRLVALEDNVLFYTWPCFLSEQRELEVLQVLHCMLGTAFYPAIETNFYTLTKIALNIILTVNYHDHDCANDKTKYFDLVIFKNCFVLKELYIRLSRPPRCTGAWDSHVGNFTSLPNAIEVLAFQNITFCNEDLQSVTRLNQLKSLGIVVSSGPQIVTVDRELFGGLFYIRQLQELLLQGIEFEVGLREDMYQFKHYFYPMFPSMMDTLYIRHKQDPKACQWKIFGKKIKTMEYKFEDDNIIYEV